MSSLLFNHYSSDETKRLPFLSVVVLLLMHSDLLMMAWHGSPPHMIYDISKDFLRAAPPFCYQTPKGGIEWSSREWVLDLVCRDCCSLPSNSGIYKIHETTQSSHHTTAASTVYTFTRSRSSPIFVFHRHQCHPHMQTTTGSLFVEKIHEEEEELLDDWNNNIL
jgi:hypothetical protein